MEWSLDGVIIWQLHWEDVKAGSRAYLEEVCHWGHVLYPVFLCFLLTMNKLLCSATGTHHDVQPHLRPIAVEPADYGPNPLKPGAKIILSSVKLLMSGFLSQSQKENQYKSVVLQGSRCSKKTVSTMGSVSNLCLVTWFPLQLYPNCWKENPLDN